MNKPCWNPAEIRWHSYRNLYKSSRHTLGSSRDQSRCPIDKSWTPSACRTPMYKLGIRQKACVLDGIVASLSTNLRSPLEALNQFPRHPVLEPSSIPADMLYKSASILHMICRQYTKTLLTCRRLSVRLSPSVRPSVVRW